jgi:4-coumarate--CoA ligase
MNTVVCTGPYLGFYTVLMRRYTLLDLVKLSSEIKANTLRILPTIAIAIAKEPKVVEFDLTSVKFVLCSGAPLSKEILGSLQQRLGGAAVFQGYGYA